MTLETAPARRGLVPRRRRLGRQLCGRRIAAGPLRHGRPRLCGRLRRPWTRATSSGAQIAGRRDQGPVAARLSVVPPADAPDGAQGQLRRAVRLAGQVPRPAAGRARLLPGRQAQARRAPVAPLPAAGSGAGRQPRRSEITRAAPAKPSIPATPARALQLAVGVGERWIAGLAAWRLKDYAPGPGLFRPGRPRRRRRPLAALRRRLLGRPLGRRRWATGRRAHGFLRLAARRPRPSTA